MSDRKKVPAGASGWEVIFFLLLGGGVVALVIALSQSG